MKKRQDKVETKEFLHCERCNRDSDSTEWIPCPRGNCEAKKVGQKITTTKYVYYPQ